MGDPLSSNTQEQMQALCRKISVAHDLDPEIQKELYGHMEDKLLAYLSGEEQATEEDALILVREHFGDPAVLKGLLQDVHAYEVHVSLARRLAAAFAATTGLMVLWNVFLFLVTVGCIMFAPEDGSFTVLEGGLLFGGVLASICATVFLWLALHHWQRQVGSGWRVWFLRWQPGSIVALIAVLFLVQKFVPVTYSYELMTVPSVSAARLLIVFGLLSLVFQCLAWLWWCDRPPRKAKAITCAFFFWSLTCVLRTAVPRLRLFISRDVAEQASGVVMNHISLAQGHLLRSSFHWQLRWPTLSPLAFVKVAAFTFAYVAGCAFVACILYTVARRVRGRYAEPVQPDVMGPSDV